jgi:RNA polymerase sigma-70 factor (ECF subfamily)
MMEESDALAVAQAQAGNQAAFRLLVERHSQDLFRLAYRMTGNEQDAEDLVQETFLRAFRKLRQFEARANFGTWLHRIAANCALDLLRKRDRHEQRYARAEFCAAEDLDSVPDRGPSPADAICHGEMSQTIHSALDQLTAMERTAFVLRHFEHHSIEEIGRALDLGQSAAKQAIFRAVQKMRQALEPILRSPKCST